MRNNIYDVAKEVLLHLPRNMKVNPKELTSLCYMVYGWYMVFCEETDITDNKLLEESPYCTNQYVSFKNFTLNNVEFWLNGITSDDIKDEMLSGVPLPDMIHKIAPFVLNYMQEKIRGDFPFDEVIREEISAALPVREAVENGAKANRENPIMAAEENDERIIARYSISDDVTLMYFKMLYEYYRLRKL